jgi:tetratricopeptide (TPR) repeat protein
MAVVKPVTITELTQLAALLSAGRHTELERAVSQRLAQLPDSGELWKILSVSLGMQGKPALQALTRAAELLPQDAEAHSNLGHALRGERRFEEAVASYRRALHLQPNFTPARKFLDAALQDLAVAQNERGSQLRGAGRIDEAERCFRRAIENAPGFALAHNNLAIVLRVEGRFTEALSSCRRALEIDPRLLPALGFMGELLADQGEFDQARQMFERVIALDPNSASAWAGICGLRRMTPADTHWLAGARRIVSQNLTPQAEAQLRYAMGKYLDDVAEYPAAFAEYRKANEVAKRYTPKYQRLELTQAIDATIRRYNQDWLSRSRCDTNTAAAPVFVVGMPRSGTTLCEQILGSHPEARSVGELPFWTNATAQYEAAGFTGLCAFGEEYVKLSGAARTIDKMPANFRCLGTICAALPNARIIHMRRNPIDTCLSIYFQNFDVTHPYANDIDDLAHVYTEYRRLMQHWARTLPESALLEVPYEGLVAEPEAWSRRMLEFAGLPWDPRCLDFHQAGRIVSSRSRWQVRQRINSTSVERWRNYEPFIGPLLTIG